MMKISPVSTAAEYDAALLEIGRLMDATVGTPRGDRLDVLVTLVEAYEEKHWRIDPPDPIDAQSVLCGRCGERRRGKRRTQGRTNDVTI